MTELQKIFSLSHSVIFFLHVSQLTVLIPSLFIQQRLEIKTFIRLTQKYLSWENTSFHSFYSLTSVKSRASLKTEPIEYPGACLKVFPDTVKVVTPSTTVSRYHYTKTSPTSSDRYEIQKTNKTKKIINKQKELLVQQSPSITTFYEALSTDTKFYFNTAF